MEQIRECVEAAHARGFTASADLLFNLPGRTLEQTLEDVSTGISTGFEWTNAATSEEYERGMLGYTEDARADRSLRAMANSFRYNLLDLELLHLTRNLARLVIDCAAYKAFFGFRPEKTFGAHFEVAEEAGLIYRPDRNNLALTAEGMFFAEAVADLLSMDRVASLRRQSEPGVEDPRDFMD